MFKDCFPRLRRGGRWRRWEAPVLRASDRTCSTVTRQTAASAMSKKRFML